VKVRWRRSAQLDLAEIDTHIRQENPQAANRVVSAIRRETVQLASTPLVGRLGRIGNTRELVMTSSLSLSPIRSRLPLSKFLP